MAAELTGLLFANVAYALVGGGLLVAAGFVDLRRSTWPRLLASYLLGIAVVVIPSSYLALAGVGVGWTAVSLLAAACLVAAAIRLRKANRPQGEGRKGQASYGVRADQAGAAALIIALLALLLYAGRTFAVKPLVEWDGWALWTLKARVLYELPASAPSLLQRPEYGAPSYPLGLPTLEALGFHAMGRFDGTVIGIQLLALAFGFVGALFGLSYRRARPTLVALALLASVAAPPVLFQLSTHYADVPLALFVAAGVAACGCWLVETNEGSWALVCAALFLGLAGLIKNEGLLFALAGVVALVVGAALGGRERLRPAGFAAGAVIAIVVPWRIYVAAHHLKTVDYDLGNAFNLGYLRDHASRVWPAARELVSQMTMTSKWGLIVPVVVLALASGAFSRRWRVSVFGAVWLLLSFGGLLLTYWISFLPLTSHLSNSSDRTIDSLLLGGAVLVPLLLFAEPLPEPRSRTTGSTVPVESDAPG